jgi:hypothetical protein
MIEERERPVVVAVHPKLEFELKKRKEELEDITGKPIKGGLTTYSEFAAFELEGIRKSGDEINEEILKIRNVQIKEFEIKGIIYQFVPYEHYKKLFIFASILKKKKDQKQINVDLSKLKGLKKNDVKIYW